MDYWGLILPVRHKRTSSVIPPVNTVLPAITGTAQVLQTLSVSNGTWSNIPVSYTYQWKRDGATIAGATTNTYTLALADEGAAITCTVTATNAGGSNSATSTGTLAVALVFSDLFTRVDGNLGSDWDGATFSIVSNTAVNAPTLAADLFKAGKGEYTSDTESWVASGTNTIQSVGGALKITYVNNDSGAFLSLGGATDFLSNMTAGLWYLLKFKTYREVGNWLALINGTPNFFHTISDTTLTQHQIYFPAGGGTQTFNQSGMGTGEIAWFDDLELFPVVTATEFAVADLQFTGNLFIRAMIVVAAGQTTGLVMMLDSASSPANYVELVFSRDGSQQLLLYKVVGGTRTLVQGLSASYADKVMIEVIKTGTTYRVWYNGAAVGTDQTISNAGIINNTLHGMAVQQGGIYAFAVGRTLTTLGRIAYVGGSITLGSVAANWRALSRDYALEQNISQYVGINGIYNNGQTAWIHLVRFTEITASTPTLVLVDLTANHVGNTDFEKGTCEALIRKIRASLPNATILFILFPTWGSVGTATLPNNLTTISWVTALANYYDCDVLDVSAAMITLLAGAQIQTLGFYTHPDWTHPDLEGNAYIDSLIEPLLTTAYIGGGQTPWTGNIADYARLYAGSSAWEGTLISRVGTSNDGETGTWVTVSTTQRRSSVATSTITYIATCSSVGVEFVTGSGTGSVRWRVDGGSWTTINLIAAANAPTQITPLGSELTTASHTLELEVISGTITVIRFVAI